MALIALMTLVVPMVLMVMMALVDPMALVRGPTCQGLLGLVVDIFAKKHEGLVGEV